jgi:uncharacterized protein (DUF58 family)
LPFVPTRRLVVLALVPLALAFAMAFWPGAKLGPAVVAVDVLLLLLALGDAVRGHHRLVSVAREAPPIFSLGRNNDVRLRVSSRAGRSLQVQLLDDHDEGLGPRSEPLQMTLAAHTWQDARYVLRPVRRGQHDLGAHHVRHPTPWGLWLRQYRLPAQAPVKVYPDVKAVRTYELLARQSREALLLRSTRQPGQESEFERLRDYTRDDAYRHIDWRATARRHKLIARAYQQERNQTIFAALDAGRLMTAESGGLARFDHALNATLMLAHVAARSGDNVGLMSFDSQVRAFVAPVSGRRAAQRVLAASYDLEPQLTESNFEAAFATLNRRLRKRALVVLFTHVVDDVSAQGVLRVVRGLGPRHLPLCVLFRDPAVEAVAEGRDPEGQDQGGRESERSLYTRAAAAEVLLWQEKLVRDLAAAGAHVLHADPVGLTPAVINRYLSIKARTLL